MIDNAIHFLLVPDANARKLVLQRLVAQGSTIGVVVGTWPELITQVIDDYCLKVETDTWDEDLRDAMVSMPDGFWAESFLIDPDESFRIVAAALVGLLSSVELGSDISAIDLNGINSERTQKFVSDLVELSQKVDRLPADLSVMFQVCTAELTPLRKICVYHRDAYPHLDVWQSSFIERLNADSGNGHDAEYQVILDDSASSAARAEPPTLQHLQQNLFGRAEKSPLDQSVQWLRVRDYLEEVEAAAGMIQSMCERDGSVTYADFSLLLPHADEYIHAVKSVFSSSAIPLSGLPLVTYYRDHGNEAVLNYLICQQKPAPVMAMAAFLTSPLLPWDKQTGIELSEALMDGKYDLKLSPSVTTLERQALSLIQENTETVPALSQSLMQFKKVITTQANTTQFHVDRAVDTIDSLLAFLSRETQIDWAVLRSLVKPEQLREEVSGETMQEGVTVTLDSREPWTTCKHLILLGFNKQRYPNQAGTSAIFFDDGVVALAQCGASLLSRQQQNEMHRQRFMRQIRSARETCSFFLSHLNPDASSNHPSESLVYMHKLLDGPEEAEDLIFDLDSESDRKLARDIRLNTAGQKIFTWRPCLDDVHFHTDLLALAEDNQVRRLSPSRLEILMVSPLAWLLSWIDIELKEWTPEEPGPSLLGKLAHGVYENLFKRGEPIPAPEQIRAAVPGLLEQEMNRIAPFMLAPKWSIERHKLGDDIVKSAIDWAHVLGRLEASIVDNEIWLRGEYAGIAIHGQADCILQLPNDRLAIVDFKKSGLAKRKDPMSKGYDCQVSLYREMLGSGLPEPHEALDVSRVEVLYYMMNSCHVVAENSLPGSTDVPGWITIENDVSVNAMALIKQRVAQIRQGDVILNRLGDQDFYARQAGLKSYAFDSSPLIRLFMKPDKEAPS